MSKKVSAVGKAAKNVSKVVHPPYMRLTIPAGEAAAGPPLGPQLGQSDRTFDIKTTMPPSTYFLKMAAGIKKGAMKPAQEIAGKVSLKHIYEIAKIKSQDEAFDMVPMEEICRSVIGTAHSCGIQVVKEIKPEEYGKFLQERKEIVAQQEKELEEQRQAKMLRL
ncbi:hypothetical protein ACJMK2_035751 [Sinanodonta woodiana]|uniref:Large ribosomal subunit protein uL11m n=1 Tax=Sinanodonta woodiana TaxID=1069815 RepID=A0ABD3WIE5_SINWO